VLNFETVPQKHNLPRGWHGVHSWEPGLVCSRNESADGDWLAGGDFFVVFCDFWCARLSFLALANR
jgi:hypothetical protein